MTTSRQAAVCVFAAGDAAAGFRECLGNVLEHTPLAQIELRLAFSKAARSLHHALGVLCPDGTFPRHDELPGQAERFEWAGRDGLPVSAWSSAASVSRNALARLVFHDVPLTAEYAICLDQNVFVEAGWWEAIVPLLDKGVDYIGQPSWQDYRPGEAERFEASRWYLGVPHARREGRPGVSFMRDGLVAVRSERLREADFPQPGHMRDSNVLLGAIAHQLGWSQAEYSEHIELKPR